MSYTGKIPQITQVDQLCCADTRRDKICRLCNTAVFIQYFFHLRSYIHCFTRFRYKIKHTFVSIVFEIIIADNMPPRKNKSHTLLAVLRVILLSTSSFVAFLPIIFLHVLPLPGIIVLILQMLGVFTLPGTLYLVATPIGNLDDMPPRVAATFGLADFVAAEDTRVTLRLLNHLGLKKPMVSYYEHALHHGEAILNRIEAGENCALCSDAGMPCISDPGEQIVREAHERGIRVVPIPAASACVTALAASGQPTARFVFEGFLPVPKRDRRERLVFLQNETRTMIFYEAPHKLRGTLDDLAAAFGADRSVSLCRELTKLHEEIKKTTLGEAVAFYKDNDPRGEYVLVLAGTDPAAVEQAAAPTLEEAVAAARALQAGGLPPAAAAKQAAAGTPFSKGEIYKELIK